MKKYTRISRRVDAEEWVSNLKDQVIENNQPEQPKGEELQNSLRDVCNMIKCDNSSIIRIRDEERRQTF